eukprot:32074-Eustigmatos_ZCMA.PRE.1
MESPIPHLAGLQKAYETFPKMCKYRGEGHEVRWLAPSQPLIARPQGGTSGALKLTLCLARYSRCLAGRVPESVAA